MTTVKTFVEHLPNRLAGPEEVPSQLRELEETVSRMEKKMNKIRGIKTPASDGEGTATASERVDRYVKAFQARTEEASYSKALSAIMTALRKAQPDLAREYAAVDQAGRDRHRQDSEDVKRRARIERRDADPQSPLERVRDQAQMAIDRGEAGAEIVRRTRELMRTNQGLNYEGAFSAVLEADPELASRYRQFAGDYQDLYNNWSGSGGGRVSGSGNQK